MEIIDDTDPDWWVARHISSGATGHIPRNYVAFHLSIESEVEKVKVVAERIICNLIYLSCL